MKKSSLHLTIIESIKYFVLILLAVVFLLKILFSFDQKPHGNIAFMHYIAYLINEHKFVPYRDIFEINMPVSYLFHIAIGKLLGYSDTALHIANLIWVSIVFVVTWLIMKPFGRLVAFASCVIFGCVYIYPLNVFYLERDTIAILPIATTILLSIYIKNTDLLKFKYFFVGVFFAVAALVKPHMTIGLPVLIIYNLIDDFNNHKTNLVGNYIKNILLSLFGFSFIIIICIIWLWQIKALESFLDILSSCIPLYSKIMKESQDSYSSYLFNSYRGFGGYGLLIVTSVLGVYTVLTTTLITGAKRLSILLLFLGFIYSLYVLFSGRFLSYHWALFIYFACLCTALIFFDSNSPKTFSRILLPLITFFFVVTLTTLPLVKSTITRIISNPPNLSVNPYIEQADETANYLHQHLMPEDLVQPLDSCIGGTFYGMLKTRAVLATPYISDLFFYHYVSSDYVQKLRQDFMISLDEKMPTFIIQSFNSNVCPQYSISNFPELDNFIKLNYTISYSSNKTIIYKKLD